VVSITLRHHRRLIPKELLHFVRRYSCLNQSNRKGMSLIVEIKKYG
jgi:hypothetical protein